MASILEAASALLRGANAPDPSVPTHASLGSEQAAAGMRRTACVGLGLCTLAFWVLMHPYGGIINDAVFYALAALARLHPQSLGHDIFLGPGSQDHYTVFSPIVASIIRVMGIGPAAALVTAAGQAALYGGAALLARRLLPGRLAGLSVALLIVLPSLYGARHIFAYTEDFMTSRVPAEAFVLASLAAALDRRFVLATLCVAVAMLLHPLTALPGVVMLLLLGLGLRLRIAAAWGFAGLAVLSLLAYWLPFWRITRIDSDWFVLLHWRMQYAFPTAWRLRDWGSMSVPLATLAAGAFGNLSPTVRAFCRTAIAIGLAGIVITVLGQDLLHILIISQVQPWRWLWLSNALAVLLLPLIVADGWRSGDSGRASIVLLAAAWMSYYQVFVPAISTLAIVASFARAVSIEPRRSRRLLMSAWAVLAIAAIAFLGLAVTDFMRQPAIVRGMTGLRSAFWLVAFRVKPWAVGGVLPAIAIASIWWVAAHRASRRAGIAVLLVGVALCTALAPYAWTTWGDPQPTAAVRAEFAPWRRQIPPAAQVLTSGVPMIPWFLLDRPSYWSIRQMAGLAFSRTTAMELFRRQYSLEHLPPAQNGAEAVRNMCASDPLIGFVVAHSNIGPTRFKPITVRTERVTDSLYLYSCADALRQRASGSTGSPIHHG